jgi:hypothetical protein
VAENSQNQAPPIRQKRGVTIYMTNPNSDKIEMSFMVAQDRLPNLAERTYRRGLRELLDKEVIFRSPVEGVFFVNIRCMFNGDRLPCPIRCAVVIPKSREGFSSDSMSRTFPAKGSRLSPVLMRGCAPSGAAISGCTGVGR